MTVGRCNQVDPYGKFYRGGARGALMGNRGPLIDADGEIERPYAHRRWISCTLERVHGWKVRFDDPAVYTPLFFTDDAVAFSAGHRPCANCRPDAFRAFKSAWKAAFRIPAPTFVSAAEIDKKLHRHRTLPAIRRGVTALASDLPAGCFVTRDGSQPLLLANSVFRPWRAGRYGAAEPIAPNEVLRTLTPAPLVAVLRAGYPIHLAAADRPNGPDPQTRNFHIRARAGDQ